MIHPLCEIFCIDHTPVKCTMCKMNTCQWAFLSSQSAQMSPSFSSARCPTIRPSLPFISATGRMVFLSAGASWPSPSSMVHQYVQQYVICFTKQVMCVSINPHPSSQVAVSLSFFIRIYTGNWYLCSWTWCFLCPAAVGNSLSAILDGKARLLFLSRDEEYVITMPYAHCKGNRSTANIDHGYYLFCPCTLLLCWYQQ